MSWLSSGIKSLGAGVGGAISALTGNKPPEAAVPPSPWSDPNAPASVAPAASSTDPSASAYPTMANDYNLGQQTAPVPGAASNPDYSTKPITVTMNDSSSRGFNPWSLSGEATARGPS
jgi:hypothetical protein